MRTRAEQEAIAEAWNLERRPCKRGHTGEWRVAGQAQGPHCAECHRLANRGWRHRVTGGVHPPRPAPEPRQPPPAPVRRESRYAAPGFTPPPAERYVLPWNRGIGPEEPTRR